MKMCSMIKLLPLKRLVWVCRVCSDPPFPTYGVLIVQYNNADPDRTVSSEAVRSGSAVLVRNH